MALDAGLQLWGSEDLVQKRAEEAEGTLNGIFKFFQSRVQLEEKYAKSLGAITSKVKVAEGGTIGQGWQSVRDQQNQHLSQSYTQSTTKTNQDMVQPIDAARKKYANDRSRLANDISVLKKEMQKRTATLNDKKNTYWIRCEYHHKEKKKLDELTASNQVSKAAKMQAQFQKAVAEMEQSSKEYRDYIGDYNDFKAKYEEAMKAFLNEYEVFSFLFFSFLFFSFLFFFLSFFFLFSLFFINSCVQAMDKERLNVISDLLRKYADQTEHTCKEQVSFFTACRDQFAVVSASKDLNGSFLLSNQLNLPIKRT